jgi:hypothetical protein
MDNWITVMSFSFPHEAHMVKAYLESCGIITNLKDEMAAQLQELANAVGGVKVLVKESDYEESIQLLKDGGYLTGDKPEEDKKIDVILVDKIIDTKTCPFCNSDNIARQKKPNIFSLTISIFLGLLFTGAVFPAYRSTYKCFDCEKEWKYKRN